jgi:HlyD family secretion protein
MKRGVLATLVIAGVVAATIGWWWWRGHRKETGSLVLYGNVDLRQVELAFNGSQRVAEVLVEEGDAVKPDEVLARLETQRLQSAVDSAEAHVAAQRSEVAKLVAGSRPEEIAQARANLAAGQTEAANDQRTLDRLVPLLPAGVSVQRDVDDARAALEMARAQVEVRQRALDLAVAGPRVEDVEEAKAVLAGNEADLALARLQLSDATLRSPTTGTIRSRLLEPGEMTTPTTAAFSIAVTDPKWVRAYVGERDLGTIRTGMTAQITIDSFPDRPFPGWIGFISSVAEFTPRNVETPELRTALSYEIRVFVKDPKDELRLGMPATVTIGTAADR